MSPMALLMFILLMIISGCTQCKPEPTNYVILQYPTLKHRLVGISWSENSSGKVVDLNSSILKEFVIKAVKIKKHDELLMKLIDNNNKRNSSK